MGRAAVAVAVGGGDAGAADPFARVAGGSLGEPIRLMRVRLVVVGEGVAFLLDPLVDRNVPAVQLELEAALGLLLSAQRLAPWPPPFSGVRTRPH